MATLAVNADAERVMQVLSNLVGDALKFVPRGGTSCSNANGAKRRSIASGDDAKRRVVACAAQRPSHGQIDEAAAAARRVQRNSQCLEQQGAYRDAFATCAVDACELAVEPEAAAGAIDRVDLSFDNRAGIALRRRIGSRDHGGGAEGVEGEAHATQWSSAR